MGNQDFPGTVPTQLCSRPAGGSGPNQRTVLPSSSVATVPPRLIRLGCGSAVRRRERVCVS
ncbi:Uncharacterised protein [Mycobacteroides abscessus]|nr:Uncharacterised protein [Mycobacteroides abscessus]